MKLTKKAIKAAPKYVICIDWKAAYKNAIDYMVLNAQDIFEAMKEAEANFDENVYLMTIAEKTSEVVDDLFIRYEDRFTCRGNKNWHITDEAHGEYVHSVCYAPSLTNGFASF